MDLIGALGRRPLCSIAMVDLGQFDLALSLDGRRENLH